MIAKIFLYWSENEFIVEMKHFTSENEYNSDLTIDISEYVSLEPLVLITNLKKNFNAERQINLEIHHPR